MNISDAIKAEVRTILVETLKSLIETLNGEPSAVQIPKPVKRKRKGHRDIRPDSKAMIVLECVPRASPGTCEQIAKLTGFSQGVVGGHLFRLVKRGLIIRTKNEFNVYCYSPRNPSPSK